MKCIAKYKADENKVIFQTLEQNELTVDGNMFDYLERQLFYAGLKFSYHDWSNCCKQALPHNRSMYQIPYFNGREYWVPMGDIYRSDVEWLNLKNVQSVTDENGQAKINYIDGSMVVDYQAKTIRYAMKKLMIWINLIERVLQRRDCFLDRYFMEDNPLLSKYYHSKEQEELYQYLSKHFTPEYLLKFFL